MHLYAWLPSSAEDLLPWPGIKAIFLSSFLGIYRCALCYQEEGISGREGPGMSECLRIEVAICRFAAVKKLGTSLLLLPISLSSRRAYSISVLKLALTYSWLGSR